MTTTEAAPLLLRTLEQVELARVTDNPWQPRTALDPDQVKEIADSITQVGLLQPPLVRRAGDGFQIAFGHYRIAALRALGLEVVELEVRQLSDAEMAIIALTENRKRRDVPPIEQYRAWQKALEIEGMTVAMLADSLGFDRSTVSNNLRLLKLPKWVLEHVDAGELSAHAAREYLCLMGSDGHFHDDVARQVMDRLTTGTPDWRADRVRFEINDVVLGRPVSEWRRLFKGTSPGGGHAGEPGFDLAKFKTDNDARVHTLPHDKWANQEWGRPTNSKVTESRSREWTCATSAWIARNNAAKKSAEGVAAAAAGIKTPKGTPAAKSSDFVKTLQADPVFQGVSPETAGPLLQALKKNELDEDSAKALGTRAQPMTLKTGKSFKALVDPRSTSKPWDAGDTTVPSYFPNIEECRTKCTWGATYASFKDGGALSLYCLNRPHFEEKVAAGKVTVMKKVERKKVKADEADAETHALLMAQAGWSMPPAVTRLLLALHLRRGGRFEPVYPDNVPYDERQKLSLWPANIQRISELLGVDLKHDWINPEAALKAVSDMPVDDTKEVLLRLIVDDADGSQLAPFVKALEAPKA
jgi:ParB/RepB/Spo0J family partition protein